MNYEQLEAKLSHAEDLSILGKYVDAEISADEVLAEIDENLPQTITQKHDTRDRIHLRAKALIALANIHWRRGQLDTAQAFAENGLAVAEEYNLLEIKAKAWNIIGNVNRSHGSFDKALEYFAQSLATHEELGEKLNASLIIGNIGIVYNSIGTYDKALEYFGKALAIHEELGDKSGEANVTANIGSVYLNLGSYDKALEYFATSLVVHEELGAKSSVALVTGNIGVVCQFLGDYTKALEYYGKALATFEELVDKSGIARITGNIGIVYNSLDDYDKALEYFKKALATHEELGDKSDVARVTGNIGAIYASEKFDGYDAEIAEEFLLKAVAISNEIGAKGFLVVQYLSLADLYESKKQDREALIYYKKYIEMKDEVQVEEIKKQAEAKEREKTLAVERALAQATNDILANILPATITERLLKGEKKIADTYENVSVLFVDIVGFTQMSAKLPASELIDILDIIFTRFDIICKKYGLEKIKTIGDAYMAVCGAPIECNNHAELTALAAFEMLENCAVEQRFSVPITIGFRIGLHSGSVVAGIIGENKYSYDLWGDAVNTASRMESHGEAERVHVSEEFRTALISTALNELPIQFIPRGEMDIKGKGMMKTYFLEKV
ncbi:MAG: tetratricopeptide repeat protein [Bacteroidetes bacterium]|nr:tetratricopeptide repeat protein [Bacteroidota bacterium]